jgi:hypothetical protein
MQLGAYLTERNLTAAAFGRRVARNRSTVARWVTGARFPDPRSLRSIIQATAGAVTAEDFLFLDRETRAATARGGSMADSTEE